MRSGFGELISEINEVDQQEAVPLGTAQWMGQAEASHKLAMPANGRSDRVWIGEALNDSATSFGYADDRHVLLVSGTRGGKGAGIIVPNLCNHRGSCIVIDPKGENATVTARRRGAGSDYARGLGQDVKILDPFNEVPLASELKARFNPLDVIDPESDLAVDDAARIAASIIVKESKSDPYWEDAARGLLKGLILHVLTCPAFKDIRNLITVRRLLMEGDWLGIEAALAAGVKKADLPSPHGFLWQSMLGNKAYGGIVSGIGEQMFSLAKQAEKAFSGVIEQARTCTEFLDSPPMRRLLEKSDFDLASIKTSPRGLTIYLTLPQRLMETHFRWLRLMVVLTIGEMERIKGRPKTGHPTLFLLDEFPGLKRMDVVLNAVAQAAGFGVKFAFIVQSLIQLREEYDESWQTFISNCGLKMFFQIDDHFSREYLSNLLGEQEVRRQSRSGSDSQSTSTTQGTSSTSTRGSSDTTSYSNLHKPLFGLMRERGDKSTSQGYSSSNSRGSSHSTSQSDSKTDGWSEGVHKRPLLTPDEIGRFLSRVDDKGSPAYPGLVVALTPGQHPLAARRINYFQSEKFEGCFDPHPDHPPPLTLAELAIRDENRRKKALPKEEPKTEVVPPRPGFWEGYWKDLWDMLRINWELLTHDNPVIGGAIVLGIIALVVVLVINISSAPASITSGVAVVANAPQVNLRSCPAANCRVITKLDKGDEVTVTKSYDNGWKAVTVEYTNGTSDRGFVNGDFLSRP
jgi:type IV secretory pathway TraG/TraD family ATPase VirD4